MKLINVEPISVVIELNATDCFALADACRDVVQRGAEVYGFAYMSALEAALTGFAVLAATDTLRDNQTPETEMIADARRVWVTDATS